MELESDNKILQKELSEIKDAIGSIYVDLLLNYKYPTKEQAKEASL
ncbi:11722_t:CDS:2 [Rhizophagus irregularis]|nr:11722_t:CDS:2 [Rhizophagus irregularis]